MALFCGTSVGLAALLAVHSARSEAAEGSLQFGRELIGIGALEGSVSRLRVNGNEVLAGANFVDMDIELVLERFRADCSERAWKMGELSGELAKAVPADAPLTLTSARAGDEGVVVCLAPGRPERGVSDFLSRARETAETGELGRLGQIHYLYARKHKSGGTNVIGVWTSANFNVHRFLGRDAELTGEDQPEIPRIPASQRVMHAELVGRGYSLRQYATNRTPALANRFYLDLLPKRGWTEIPSVAHAESARHSTFEKNGAIVILVATAVEGHTLLSMLEMPAAAAVTTELRQP